MSRLAFTTLASVLAVALFTQTQPVSAVGLCGDSYKSKKHSKCMRIIVNPLLVHRSHGGGAVCKFTNGRRFWTERKAGTRDRRNWYSVHVDAGHLWIKERRTTPRGKIRMNIAGC